MSKEMTPIEELKVINCNTSTTIFDTNDYYKKEDVLKMLTQNYITKAQHKEDVVNKQIDALAYHIPRFIRWSDENSNIETSSEDFSAYKELAENYLNETIKK